MTDQAKPVCHARRHMTPSQFMTYDAMRAMAKDDGHGSRVCYARLTTITNHTRIGRSQNRDNISALESLGWLMQEPRSRWRGGRSVSPLHKARVLGSNAPPEQSFVDAAAASKHAATAARLNPPSFAISSASNVR